MIFRRETAGTALLNMETAILGMIGDKPEGSIQIYCPEAADVPDQEREVWVKAGLLVNHPIGDASEWKVPYQDLAKDYVQHTGWLDCSRKNGDARISSHDDNVGIAIWLGLMVVVSTNASNAALNELFANLVLETCVTLGRIEGWD